MQAANSSIAAFGKVPTYGDFLRHNASGAAVRRFEDWVQRGLLQIKNHREGNMEAAYDGAPTVAFLSRGQTESGPLVGVMRTSRDAAGRRYPLVIASEVGSDNVAQLSSVVASHGPFLDAAASLAVEGASGRIEQKEFGSRVELLAKVPRYRSDGGVPEDQREFLRTTTFKELGEALWTHYEDSGKYFLFKNLNDLVAITSQEGEASPGFSFGIRFPLSDARATATASFWLAVLEGILPVRGDEVSVFWSLPPSSENPGGGTAPFIVLYFDTPTPRAFLEVLKGGRSSDGVFDLEDGGGVSGSDAALALPADLGEMLERESVTLEDVLHRLRTSIASGPHSTPARS